MRVASSTVVHLHRRAPREALEQLNRLTGLQFFDWPESLRGEVVAAPAGAALLHCRGAAAKRLAARRG